MDKAMLLHLLQDNRARFERLVSQVSETRLLEPEGKDQQSGKDVIAHLTTWEQRAVRWLKTAARGETPHSPELGATWDDMDRLNAESFAQNKDRSLQEVQAGSQRSFKELVEQVQAFSDDGTETRRSRESRCGNLSWQVHAMLTTRIISIIFSCAPILLSVLYLIQWSCGNVLEPINTSTLALWLFGS